MIAQDIPRDHIWALLADVPELAGRAIDRDAIEPLASLTNRTYKITVGAESFVLRIAGMGTDRYIDRAGEARNAGLAASLGVAPEIVHCDPSAGIMLTRFIPGGEPLQASALKNPEMIRRAARLLKRLHDSGLAFVGEMRLFPKLDQYLQQVSDEGLLAKFGLAGLRRAAEPVRQALELRPRPLVPSHIDPVPDNFVMSPGGLFLIDWEYAARAEPMWDLAGLALEAGFEDEQERSLLQTYLGAASTADMAVFQLYKSSLLLLAAAWSVLQIVVGNPNGNFDAFARQRLARHRQLMQSPAHAGAMEMLTL